MAAAFDFAEDGETFTGLGLPPVDKYTQRAEAAGALCLLGATHSEMSQGELCKKVQHQVGLGRVGPAGRGRGGLSEFFFRSVLTHYDVI